MRRILQQLQASPVLFLTAVFIGGLAPSSVVTALTAEEEKVYMQPSVTQAHDTAHPNDQPLVKAAPVKELPDYQENIKRGAKTTEQNYLNNPFKKPTKLGGVTVPETWPIFYNRGPIDRSPKDKSSKIVTLGTGTPAANTYRFGPAMAVIVNDYPYFVDSGEGWFRALNRAILEQTEYDLSNAFQMNKVKYMFVTHLHEDHTIGLPSFLLGTYKWGGTTNKVVFGPQGIDSMMSHIISAWKVDRAEMVQGVEHATPEGGTAAVANINPDVEFPGAIFEDDNVKVEAFRTYRAHGALRYTYAYRFTTKPDNRVIVFGGDGHFSRGLVEAARGADVLVIEAFSRKDLGTAPWGGDSLEKKKESVGAYHMFPNELKKVQEYSGVKQIVLVHEQDYAKPEDYSRLRLVNEVRDAGVMNVYSAMDGDVY